MLARMGAYLPCLPQFPGLRDWQTELYPEGQHNKRGDDCVTYRLLSPIQAHIAKRRARVQQMTQDAVYGRGAGKDIKVRCPETGDRSRTWPIPSSGPARVSGEDLLPQGNECGQSPESEARIWNGEDAPLSAYPWMALLGYGDPSIRTWGCGGFLINDRYVLTAAHCLQEEVYQQLGELEAIRLGEHNINTDTDCPESISLQRPCAPSPQDFTPEEITIHETFDQREKSSDDIALIRLGKTVTMGDSVGPVCVPPADLDVAKFLGSRDALVSGWGETETDYSPDTLQVASVPLFDKTRCEELYSVATKLVEEQVCFGGRGNVTAFLGDSGGPVFQTDTHSSRYTVLGVVSLGLADEDLKPIPGVPTVFTSVAHYRKWITANLKP